jgi:hypothetical protein
MKLKPNKDDIVENGQNFPLLVPENLIRGDIITEYALHSHTRHQWKDSSI